MEPSGEIIRILIADDHHMVRQGLRVLLETQPDFRVVGEAADGEQAVQLTRRLQPDILLLDVAMPERDGLDALQELARATSPVRTILLTAAIEKQQILEALQLGACGIVLKESATELLFKCIRTVMAGQQWVGRETVSDLLQHLRERVSPPGAEPRKKKLSLTQRELDIVAKVVAGSTNKEIAQAFSISEETVKHHLTSIFDKTGVSNRLELALFALRQGLVKNP